MPTYEYQCRECDHLFETFHSITAEPLKKCPKCGRNTLKRLLGAGAGIIFKGSGFYETDYRSSDYASRAKADSAASKSDTGSQSSSKTGSGKKAADKKSSDAKTASS